MRFIGRRSALEDRVVQAIVTAVERHGYGCRVERGGVVRLTGPNTGEITFAEVRAVLSDLPAKRWAAAIYEHVSGYLTELELSGERSIDLDDTAARPEALRTRIYLESDVAGGDALSVPLVGDLVEVCMVDGERALRTVSGRLVRSWDLSVEEAFTRARAATREHTEIGVARHDAGGVEVVELYGSAPCVTSCVRWLGELVELPHDTALVALPARGAVLVHPVTRQVSPRCVRVLGRLADRIHQDEPGPLSADVYLYRDGAFGTFDAAAEDAQQVLAALASAD